MNKDRVGLQLSKEYHRLMGNGQIDEKSLNGLDWLIVIGKILESCKGFLRKIA